MERFNLSALSDNMHAAFPVAERRPVIGITGNYDDATCKLAEGYYKQVARAGGVPLIIPPLDSKEALVNTLERIDGLLLSGGADINPLFAGEQPLPQLGGINAERDRPELLLTQLACNRQLPILGICRGIQTMTTALGGKVWQDIAQCQPTDAGTSAIKHSQDAGRQVPTHTVEIAPGSTLYNIYARAKLAVNSFHHQAVADAGKHFRVAATAPDGVIEAIESAEHKPMLGVQWHPECMGDDGLPLFLWLVGEAGQYRAARQLHQQVLTLDTHCDTPMFFPQGVDIARRDPRILVDLHKMAEGGLDATIMVAYLPQPTAQPRQYADQIFNKIEQMVAANQRHVALARTPDDLFANKAAGRRSIMLGIENGIALEGDLQNVAHFARRGVGYITLCHNGDNELCDSAKGQRTHGGISELGRRVIGEMNRLGIMVDLSHASEESFYDAIAASRQPIVCSHSSARALCNHPRNLTDDQMRALAQSGGVCQITLYPGFLKTTDEATILDAMAHLEHAIGVMGVDHVGLGTDFDGDGGVPGLADAAELLNFTRQLLARRYSVADIEKIWGGNFLRVMRQVQAAATQLQ